MNKTEHSGVCRFCGTTLHQVFIDLGISPLSNAYLTPERLKDAEKFYPLLTYVCSDCLLVQLEQYEPPENIFSDYAYFSSYSDSWMEHGKKYTAMVIDRFKIDKTKLVVELASNDGYLLKNFTDKEIPVLGVEPAENVAKVAIDEGIPTITKFFGKELAQEMVIENKKADLIIGNNVLAHVPNLNDFVGGIKLLLNHNGVATLEFPHLLNLIKYNQFDTIYHEHFSYFSFIVVKNVFAAHNLTLFDVEELETHGGSLRIYACHNDNETRKVTSAVESLLRREKEAGLHDLTTYLNFSETVKKVKLDIVSTLFRIRQEGNNIIAYGAAAKGNTLLNYCGIGKDIIDYVVDRNPHKQGRYLPGTRIPIKNPECLKNDRPNYVLILPWNIKDEVMTQINFIRTWGGKFIIPIPTVQVV